MAHGKEIHPADLTCGFRRKWSTSSEASGPPIPREQDHPFRGSGSPVPTVRAVSRCFTSPASSHRGRPLQGQLRLRLLPSYAALAVFDPGTFRWTWVGTPDCPLALSLA